MSGQKADLVNARAANVATKNVEAFCVERTRQPPTAGMEYRVAPADVQQQFKPLQDVLRAAGRLQQSGGLHPDSDPKNYFDSIRQWAIWAKQEGFDQARFTQEFLAHTRKNVEAAKAKWNGDMEKGVQSAAPGRWADIQLVLREAMKGKIVTADAVRPVDGWRVFQSWFEPREHFVLRRRLIAVSGGAWHAAVTFQTVG